MSSAFPPPAGRARAIEPWPKSASHLNLFGPTDTASSLGEVQRAVLDFLYLEPISHYPRYVATQTKRPRSTVTRVLLRLRQLALVEVVDFAQWQITDEGRRVAMVLRTTR